MLKDYFSISFETAPDGRLLLRSLPLLLVDFEPFYGYLPLFLYRLGVEVSYSDEQTCLYRIAKELAQFYAYLPASGEKEETEEWKNVFQSALYPQLKRQMIVSDRLWSSGTIQLMASTDRLYRVFERCWGVCWKQDTWYREHTERRTRRQWYRRNRREHSCRSSRPRTDRCSLRAAAR